MKKSDVISIMGKHDRINGDIYIYEDRLISGWSWDKADFHIGFNSEDKVNYLDRSSIRKRNSNAITMSQFAQGISMPGPIEDDFCAGYREGYLAGICDGIQNCLQPLTTPLCPLSRIHEKTNRDGYNRGFKDGLKK